MMSWLENKIGSKTMFVVAFCVVVLFSGALYGVFFVKIPAENRSAGDILFGALIGSFLTVVNFYFGSSSSAREMRQSLQHQVDNPEPAQNVERQTVQNQQVGAGAPRRRRA